VNTVQTIRNATTNLGRTGISTITNLLLTPLIIHHLGVEAFGIWALCLAVAGYFNLLDLGITSAAARYISHYRALEDWDELNKTISTSLTFYSGAAIISVLLALAVSLSAPHLVNVTPSQLPALRGVIVVMGFVAGLGFLTALPIQCVLAAQRWDSLNVCGTVVQALSAVASLVAVVLGAKVYALAIIMLVGGVANGLAGYLLCRRYLPQARFRPKWDRVAAVITMSNRVIYFSDNAVIAGMLSVEAVAAYAVAMKVVELMKSLVNAGSCVLGTVASEQSALGNTDTLRHLWIEGSKWSLVITLPMCLLFVLLGRGLLGAWIGQVPAGSVAVLACLAIAHVVDLSQMATYQILVNSGHHRFLARVLTVEAVANLGLSVLLIRYYGVFGVALGTAIPIVVRSGIVLPVYMSKLTGVSLGSYWREVGARPSLSAIPAWFLIVACWSRHIQMSRIGAVILVFAVLALAGTSAYVVCATPKQRVRLRSAFGFSSVPGGTNEWVA